MTKTPHDVDIIVGTNIRTLRTARRITQEKLGEALGITFQQVQKYEKGSNRVSASRLAEIAAFLECGLADLFAGTTMTGTANVRPAPLSPTAMKIARMCDTLTAQQRDAVLRFLRSFQPIDDDFPHIETAAREDIHFHA